ncbi:hypothetical protein NO1_1447 [Candidatus Termititenax aidoneus]|uniref:Uncharacterized protein n=1 Tax=Termititenax aidoneus TaxID=2218524 RepID=A0A388TBN9_TERA1|nr:hypothetical protein NO1_1447 [Candidatus Termititenax aidoneus]
MVIHSFMFSYLLGPRLHSKNSYDSHAASLGLFTFICLRYRAKFAGIKIQAVHFYPNFVF